MIDIPEEQILKEITDILMNDLPKVLLELEEQSEASIRLPPFRYVGLEESLPSGTSLPYAFVEIEEVTLTEKDRVIKNQKNTLKITFNTSKNDTACLYYYAFRHFVESGNGLHLQIKQVCYSCPLTVYFETR